MNKLHYNPNFFILTGGPGSGKTTILNELACRGFLIVSEVARGIIQEQNRFGGTATHNADRGAFCDLMLERSIVDYERMYQENRVVFFDRGIPDLYGYSKAFCDGIKSAIEEAVIEFRYNNTVFVFPPWEEIYQQDKERKQDFQEAVFTYTILKDSYTSCDYSVVEVPTVSIEQRVDFILDRVSSHVFDIWEGNDADKT